MKRTPSMNATRVLIFCLVISLGVIGWLTIKVKDRPIQYVDKEVIVEVPVEKIKYVKQRGLKTPTDELIKVLNPKIDPELAKIIGLHVEKASDKYGLPIPLILAVIRKESNYRPLAVSKVGAQGLMQVMPKIHKKRYKGKNLYHISTNIDIGCQIMREYLDKEGTLDKMFHAYLSKNAKKSVIDSYRNDIKKFWVKLEMHDYENGKDDYENGNDENKEVKLQKYNFSWDQDSKPKKPGKTKLPII